MDRNIRIISFTGKSVSQLIPQIAKLRIEVFKEYPFLYIGDLEYEKRYLKKFATMKDAIVVVAFDGDEVIGISTAYPLVYDSEEFKELFRRSHHNPEDYYCFGESVLRKSYRGSGIGKKFFEERESHVRKLGNYRYICFYTVMRPENDPRRPPDYRSLAPFWKNMGYVEHPELIGTISWQEIGELEETPKQMVFWIKPV